jgi:membrane protein implicated in regulation of membrane protease activity
MKSKQRVFWRYTAFQIPGWMLAAAIGWLLNQRFNIPWWLATCFLVAWVIKDYALYPFLRFSYEINDRKQIDRLIGAKGKAVNTLAPNGYVRVRGELWRAINEETDQLKAGSLVSVVSVKGMTVIVRSANMQASQISSENH